MALHIRVDCHNVIGWRLGLKSMRTPPTHYFLESSGRAAFIGTMTRGGPTVGYKWTSWVWGTTGWSWRLPENYPSFRGIYGIYLKRIKQNWKMSTWNWWVLESLESDRLCPNISRIPMGTHAPTTPKFLSGSSREIVGDCVEKKMLAHHFSQCYSRRCRRMVLVLASLIIPSPLYDHLIRRRISTLRMNKIFIRTS